MTIPTQPKVPPMPSNRAGSVIRSPAQITVSAVDPCSAEWDALLGAFPDYTIFHTSAWLATIQAAYGVRPVCVKAERGGRCVAIWPYLEQRKGPFRIIGSPLPGWSTAYMGPLIAEDVEVQELLGAFLEHRLFKRYAYFACRTLIHRHDVDLTPFGFELVRKFETYWTDLSRTEEDLWAALESRCRNSIRKAEKTGAEIRLESDAGFLEDFWRMSEETFAKSQIQPTYTREFCQQVWERLTPARHLHALSAFVDGKRAATLILPFNSHTMYYWGGATFQEFRNIPVSNLLIWRSILDAKAMGLKRYDFISSDGGPGRFKKSFGPQAVDLARHWERSPSRLLKILKDKYSAYLKRKRHIQAAQ
ncbi:lipid II:glycine glycyltransferase FemX [Desulfurivibrio sp. D14AmB]|uniref:lipid II:glycine glycyltransferase FemX n=1 Tax=Desulfurivibrio sp. D14AmB TaxID=3374370 RepID=UPI00376EB243